MSGHAETRRRSGVLRGVALALGLVCATAVAAPGEEGELRSGGGPERPWARGVSPAQQEAATRLFREANGLLHESLFSPAAERYREALAQWDHPAIHYNLALALLNLDQPMQVYAHLEAALRYGPAPVGQDKYEHARSYKVLVEKQLARVDVSCEVPGARVVMDGRELFIGPGRYEGLVRAGPHVVSATKAGHLPTHLSPSLPPGETTRLQLRVHTAEELTQYRRPMAEWVPWTVLGSGAAVAAGGALVHLEVRRTYALFDEDVRKCGGCYVSGAQERRLQRSELLQPVAIGAYAVGGAALATGAVLLYFNRPVPYRPDSDTATPPRLVVAPLLGPGEGGVLAHLRF